MTTVVRLLVSNLTVLRTDFYRNQNVSSPTKYPKPNLQGHVRQGIPIPGAFCCGRTELTGVSEAGVEFLPIFYREVRYGIQAVPNLTEELGRMFTEQIPPVYFRYGLNTLPNTP